MSSLEQEVLHIRYIKETYTEKTTTINKKLTLPLFREWSSKEFLTLVQDFEDWTVNHDLNQDIHIDQVYEGFDDYLKGDTRNIWITILKEDQVQ